MIEALGIDTTSLSTQDLTNAVCAVQAILQKYNIPVSPDGKTKF